MKKEELQEIIKEAVKPLSDKIEGIEAEINKGQVEEEEESEDGAITTESIAKAVKEALEPLSERIGKIENYKGISKQLEHEEEEVKKSTSTFAGLDI